MNGERRAKREGKEGRRKDGKVEAHQVETVSWSCSTSSTSSSTSSERHISSWMDGMGTGSKLRARGDQRRSWVLEETDDLRVCVEAQHFEVGEAARVDFPSFILPSHNLMWLGNQRISIVQLEAH